MKNKFEKLLIIILITYVSIYMIENITGKNILGIDNKVRKLYLSENDNFIGENNINIGTELALVNSEHGLDKSYMPEDLTIPNISFLMEGVRRKNMYQGL